MKNISYYYLTFIKVLLSLVLLFAIFGTINDALIEAITGYSFPNTNFLEGKKSIIGFYVLQHIGFALIYLIIYKNYIQFIGFIKNKKRKSLSPFWTKYLLIFGGAFILLFYVVLLIVN